ncbi:hypothetical protein ANANG_G00256750 [Anguilla anguilla]|uniref:Uncharacterized protein n=1 Tax=Anguilla anguilla TaxID=7936 RepID=A0A9D3LUA3_ANGAN|nr:hypothetical protein ANANG_G00256750 [Anguilla anguilla]
MRTGQHTHISSRRHRDGVAGKPNPLLSRHKKRMDLASTLSFSKDLPKALGAGLLPSPLAVAAAMAAAASSSPLALRSAGPAHPHAHLLQGPPLSHALLRPAPGPIRTTHGPILFSPTDECPPNPHPTAQTPSSQPIRSSASRKHTVKTRHD